MTSTGRHTSGRAAPGASWATGRRGTAARIALAEGGRVLQTFRGEVAGEIVDEPRGSNGFGYDPYFLYEPYGLTFAEIAPERKLAVSHKGRAVGRTRDWLFDNLPSCHIAGF